jgi:hypothetical protein
MADLYALAARLQRINDTDARLAARDAAALARDAQVTHDLATSDRLSGAALAMRHALIDLAQDEIVGERNKVRAIADWNRQDRERLAADAKAAGVTIEQLQALIDEEDGHA